MSDQPPGLDDGDDGAPLGAAATVPVGRHARAEPPGSVPRRRGRVSVSTRFMVVLGAIVLLALIPLLRSSLQKTPRNRVGISYGGGPFEGTHFQRIVAPGHPLFFNGFFDPLYLYPADQQSYIVSKQASVGNVKTSDSIVAPSRDRVQVEYQVAIYFKLDTDRLRAFHEELGLRYAAYTATGWKNLLQDTFRQQLENTLQRETRKYDVGSIFSNADLLSRIQRESQKTLSDRLKAALGEQFFCGPTFSHGGKCSEPTFIIKKIDIPTSVVNAFQRNRTSQIQILTNQNTIAQRQAEAQAIDALNSALRNAGMNYVLLRAIESGKVNFWVVPSDTGLTLQTGGAPTGPAAPSSSGGSSSSTTNTTTTTSPRPSTTTTTKPRR